MKKLYTVAVTALLVLTIVIGISILFSNQNKTTNNGTQNYTYSVVHAYPHDTSAFTEGLVYAEGFLYESTGLYGSSTLRRVDLTSGDVLQETHLGGQFFGEGLAVLNDSFVQLTWQEHVGFVYDRVSFALLQNFTYGTEGWGLTFDGQSLIVSDGTDNLYFLDPFTFQRTGQVQVREGNAAVANLNELEYVNGDVYANIFQQQKIAIINPQTGQVKAWIDLTGLQDLNGFNSEMVLNGIAYDNQNGRLFVTGKNWPQLFEIELVPQQN